MIAEVVIPQKRTYQRRLDLVVYSTGYIGDDGAYAIARRVRDPEKNECEPWQPVTMEFVQELARGLGVELPREILPASVLCRTQDVIVWWTPPAERTLFFADSSPLAALSGDDFPVPALVWRLELKDRRLFLRALRAAERPEAGTPLYVAPFLNVYDTAAVCQGSMRRPKIATLSNLAEWETGFFGAAGTQQLAKRATTYSKGLFGLWRMLKGKKAFPDRFLAEAGESLAKFIGGK